MNRPSTNGANGRDAGGRFGKGNAGGPGNPLAKHVQRLRSALLKAVTPDDLHIIVKALIEAAKGGDAAAAKLLLGYTVGRNWSGAVEVEKAEDPFRGLL